MASAPHSAVVPSPEGDEPPSRGCPFGLFLLPRQGAKTTLALLLELDVTVIADAGSAWRLLDEDAKEFDVITVDLRLSGLSGRALFERVERELPRLAARVIFITGEIADADSEVFLERSGRPTLRKPFSVKALIASLATLLARGPASTTR